MFIKAIDGAGADEFLLSPPDIFAVCAKIAKLTGCYLQYAEAEKPHLSAVGAGVADGRQWARSLSPRRKSAKSKIPREIVDSWDAVCAQLRKYEGSSEELSFGKDTAKAVLYLIVAADSACKGIGLPVGGAGKYFGVSSSLSLVTKGTLCKYLGSRYGRVLPKRHTPKFGLNLRNLTRNIAYCEESEVSIEWLNRDYDARDDGRSSFNLMVIPWPFDVAPTSIVASERKPSNPDMGYFEYVPRDKFMAGRGASVEIARIVKNAMSAGHRVDLVVLPECSLSVKEWSLVKKSLSSMNVATLSGVHGRSADGLLTNSVRLNLGDSLRDEMHQYKHHRWKIEKNQIENYGLGGTLSCSREWWENISIPKRKVSFLAFSNDLVVCPLICEDLARQEPVADIVRSIGPNLVIALLMDGPQLPGRWSARYASVLADDPGSSVLTVSSLGMVKLSNPPPGVDNRKVIASWKAAAGSFTEICLVDDSKAALLNLQFQRDCEQTVDGKNDDAYSSIPVLTGVHYVK